MSSVGYYQFSDAIAERVEKPKQPPLILLNSIELSMGIVNALVGITVLTLPQLVHLTGIPWFTATVCFCGFNLFGSMLLLAKCTELTGGEVSLHELTRLAFENTDNSTERPTCLSRNLPIALDIFVFIDCFVGNVVIINFIASFCLASNTVIHGVPTDISWLDYKIVIGILSIILTAVTGNVLSEMRWTNLIGFWSLVITTFFTIGSPIWLDMEFKTVISPYSSSNNVLLLNICKTFSISGFALVNYFCASGFFAGTKNKEQFTFIVSCNFFLVTASFVLYGVFGAASIGAVTFFEKDADTSAVFPYYYIETNYTSELIKKITGVVFIALGTTLITKIPIYVLPMIDGVKEIYIQLMPTSENPKYLFG